MLINLKLIADGARIGSKWILNHAPTILTAFGVCMMASGTVTAVIESPKAKEELDELENDQDLTHKEYLMAKVKIIAKHFWHVTILELGGAAAIFWSDHISLGQTAAAIAAYNMKAEDLEKLEKKVIEKDGEKAFEKMKDDIAKEDAMSVPFNSDTIINTGHGTHIFYDAIGKRYFLHDIEYIRQRATSINFDMANDGRKGHEMMRSLNDFYVEIDLPELDGKVDGKRLGPPIGDKLGWRNKPIKLRFTSMLMPNGEPCTVMGFAKEGEPVWDFDIDPDDCRDYDGYDQTDWRDR